MREMDVEFVRFNTEVDVVNLDQYFRVGLMFFFVLLENKSTKSRFSSLNKILNQPKQPKKVFSVLSPSCSTDALFS